MNINRTDLDSLNTLINITVDRIDFSEKVTSVLIDYRKNANIPGFRKGHVPMGMIKKQHEKAVIAEEVNKILRENLDKFIKEEKLELLGNPIPKPSDELLNWDSESLNFEFELGISPKFDVKLDILKKVVHFKIEPDDKMVNEQLDYVAKQYGKLVSKSKPDKNYEITAQFLNEAIEIDKMITFTFNDLKSKKVIKELKSESIGSVINIAIKNLFKDNDTAKRLLSIDEDKLVSIQGDELSVNIKEVNERIPADLNQELFDKLFEPGLVKSIAEFKDKTKENLQKQFEPQADQKLLNDVTEYLVEKTKFDLPSEFLKKWMQNSGKEPLTPEAAEEEFNKSEKGIRYQLIEGKIIKENKLDMTFDELKKFAASLVQNQMMQYGQKPDPQKIDGIVSNILSNQDETRRISEQLMSNKMLSFFKEKAPLKVKKVGFDAFVKQAYGKA